MLETNDVKPQWRTPDVLALCHGMRQQNDYSASPILADALQEAGGEGAITILSPPRPLCEFFRTETDSIRLEAEVARLASDELAEHVKWVRAWVAAINDDRYTDDETGEPYGRAVTYEMVMAAAKASVAGDTSNDSVFLNWDTPDVAYEKREEFWARYAAIVGRPEVAGRDAGLFHCFC